MFDSIHSSFESDTVILSIKKRIRGKTKLSITIDSTIISFRAKLSGNNPSVVIQDPSSTTIKYKTIVGNARLKIIEVIPVPGKYELTLEGPSSASWEVEITGKSTFNLEYGYALSKDAYICSTYRNPIAGGK